MARIVRIHQHGGPEVLRLENHDVPPPKAGEVQIRVAALGLNRAEALLRAGRYIQSPPLPSGLGLEAAGTIAAVGADVDGFQPGDAVSIIPPVLMADWSIYGELFNYPAAMVVPNPPGLSAPEAAALWMANLTAWGALIGVAQLRAGEQVVITAASSSVGLAAIQIARRVGAIPIAVTRTQAKAGVLRDAGAAQVIALSDGPLATQLDKASGGHAIRVVFDAVGGPALEELTAAMSPGGILIEYGGLSPQPTPFPLLNVLARSLTLRGYLVHEVVRNPQWLAAAKAFILAGLADGALRPVIAHAFPLEQIAEAHQYLEASEQIGKVVVTV